MHLGVAELVEDVVDAFGRGQLTARWSIGSETSTPTTRPGAAARAASRVVNPVPQPMSTTWSPGRIP